MAQQIRGLLNFIADIRSCKTEEEENERVEKELAKIRQCFSATSVTAYNKKKYMWKIMYMYMLGYTVDFGHMQCVDLISSETYSEKNVGYVGVSLLLIEHTDLLRLCIQSIKKDLASRNEIFQSLALTCIANVGGEEFAESLTTDVQRLLVSQTARNFVRKKAALTLLRLLRQYPDNVPPPEFAPQVIKLMEHRNVGVVTSIMSLLTGLATYDPHNYEDVVPHGIKLLTQFVLSRECSKDYLYYRTPCPWLQVKLLRILQYYAAPTDRALLNKLHDVLDRIVTKTEVTQSVNKNNADHAILFEAINVIIHLNLHGQDMLHERAIQQLQKFIAVKEGNIRYLGLDAMARLAKIGNTHRGIKKQLRTVQYSLDDQDISIRKRALDLLYSICDETNVEEIIDHLLRYLTHAEYAIREEMVLKIAILAEKFSTDLQWYINVVLQLITVAGDFITDDVWHRVVQIVTNNEDLQEYAAQTVFENLQEPPVHESLVKVGGYILGEFGHLLQADGEEQFAVLHRHFITSSLQTQALLLSTYMKFANLFEHLVPRISQVFQVYTSAIDPEIQQRAVEYDVMANYSNQELISRVLEAMPEFPERESNLVRIAATADNAARVVQNEDDDEYETGSETDDDDEDGESDESESDDDDDEEKTAPIVVQARPQPAMQAPQDDLLGDFFSAPVTQTAGGGGVTLEQDNALFIKLLLGPGGVLFENDTLQVQVRSQVEPNGLMKIKLLFVNKTSAQIGQIVCRTTATDGIDVAFRPDAPFDLGAGGKVQVFCRVLCSQPHQPPDCELQYRLQGVLHTMRGKFPVASHKFCAPHMLAQDAFRSQWAQLPSEQQQVVKLGQPLQFAQIKSAVQQGMGVGVIEGTGDNLIVGCSVFTVNAASSPKGMINLPALIRLEFNPQALAARVTVKSPNDQVGLAILGSFNAVFG